ncbi:unnamed protein product [Discosporangium mesarthrocarpum]
MHALGDDGHVDALLAAFREQFNHEEYQYKGHSVCSIVRPRFVARSRHASLAGTSRDVMAAIDKAQHAVVADQAKLLPELGDFIDIERRLLNAPTRPDRTGISVRLDATAHAGGWGFFELNGGIPGGIEIVHRLSETFRRSSIFRQVAQQVPLEPFDLRRATCASLQKAWQSWGGSGQPTVALVDWIEDAPLIHEFEIFVHWMEEIGLDCMLVDPRELEIVGDRLVARGVAIDIVYRRLTLPDMVQRPDDTAVVTEAAVRNLACIIDPFLPSVLDRKSIFALLTDPRFDFGLTVAERQAVDDSLPWTRLLRAATTVFPDGSQGDLLEWVRRRREHLILKPNHDYGGRGVHLGAHMSAAEWDAAIEDCLQHDFIVQTLLSSETEAFPTLESPLDPIDMEISTDPYVFDGELQGILCRTSSSGISNVTSGGGMIPTFIVDD